ncbi:hypothetical protein FF1_018852 [Malus domestica]
MSSVPSATSTACTILSVQPFSSAAQMTSVNNLAANFATCSRLVKTTAGVKLIYYSKSLSFIGAKDGDSLKIAKPLEDPILQQYCFMAREFGIWLSR